MSMPRPLRLAILYWKSGRPAPLHIEMALVDLGFELYVLESKYRT
jgi:hypothetical protein